VEDGRRGLYRYASCSKPPLAAPTLGASHDSPVWERFGLSIYSGIDAWRRTQAGTLAALGYGPQESSYRIVAAAEHWRLRAYAGGGEGPVILIIASPIKRPHIWDLAPSVSGVRRCLEHGARLFLLEWTPPSLDHPGPGLADYAGTFIGEAVAQVAKTTGVKPVLFGHSLGGTLAAIYAASSPNTLRGLVLLTAPLCFAPGTSPFRDALVAMSPRPDIEMNSIPGSLLAHLSAIVAPNVFVWSRLRDEALGKQDHDGITILRRVDHWTLDEVPVSGALVRDVFQLLYDEDRFCRGTLRLGQSLVCAKAGFPPTLAVINASDEVTSRASVARFFETLDRSRVKIIEYPGEVGVGLQHLAVLIGRTAHQVLWPEILSWLDDLN
jgi:polyhydroxyalkanoate synthase